MNHPPMEQRPSSLPGEARAAAGGRAAWRLLATLVVAVALVASSGCGRRGRAGAENVRAKLPPLESIDGRRFDIATEGAGDVILLNRWATWCGPCIQEIPGFLALEKKYGAKGFRVYGLSDEDPELQKETARRLGVDYPLLKEPAGMPEPFRAADFIPQTFLIARDGRLAHRIDGMQDEKAFEEMIRPLIEERRP